MCVHAYTLAGKTMQILYIHMAAFTVSGYVNIILFYACSKLSVQMLFPVPHV